MSFYTENLLIIEESTSECMEFNAIPLPLKKNKRQTEAVIEDLKRKLSLRA